MPDEASLRRAFEARLALLGLDALAEAERERLWRTHLTQARLSARFDATVPPATEPALSFQAGRR